MKKGTIVFDFDGVIHSYISGWQGVDRADDPPVKGIKESIDKIRNEGYEVIVVSTRCAQDKGINTVTDYLDKYDIKVDKVMAHKPPALVYIDDRAITFDGNSLSLLYKIKTFIPWTRNENLIKKFVSEPVNDISTAIDHKFGEVVDHIDEDTKNKLYKFISVLNKEELAYYLTELYNIDKTGNIEEDLNNLMIDRRDEVNESINDRIIRKYGSL